MTESRRRTRSGNSGERIPQRVEHAAQNMNASSGPRRGYIPNQAGGNPNYQAQGQPYYQPGQNYMPPQQPAQQQMPGAQPMNRAGYPQIQQQPYYGNTQSSFTGAHRGFVYPQAAQAQPPKKKKHTGLIAAILSILLIAGLGTGAYFAVTQYQHTKQINDKVDPYESLFCPGVYVDGIHLGGMTPEQAMNSVQSQIKQRHDAWQVQLTYNGSVLAQINADMLEFSVDPAPVLNQAWQQGHTGDKEQRYEAMLRLEQEPYSGYTAKPDGNTQVIDNKLAEIKASIDTDAVDAALEAFDPSQSYPFIFRDEAYGMRLDTEPIKERLYQMVSTMESGTVELQPVRLEPNVRKEELIKHYMQRASVTTAIDKHSTENRNKNIARAFEFINGYVLNPGKTFSFNGVVGERTEENGFYPAIEYVYGEHVEGFGGGVCQASTTLYQAAVCAGMQVLKREPHSDSVSYADYGKDATVYWVGKRKIDLTFKNTTENPIYITAGVLTDPSNKRRQIARVTIYGEDMGDVWYELQSEVVETLPAPFKPVYKKDTDGTYVTYTDQQESVSKAKEGYIVKSYRVQYTGNSVTEKKELFTDTYQPKAEVIYVGVKSRN